MITTEQFKKLVSLGEEYRIYVDEDLVSLWYDDEQYDEEQLTEEERCMFFFEDGRFNEVYHLGDEEAQDAEWTVEKVEKIDWQTL